MTPRFSLAMVLLFLVGGAIALWWNDREQPAATVINAQRSEAAPAQSNLPAPFSGDYVLALSWHPTFCETRPGIAECRVASAGDYTATNFSLHGLWPQDAEYCGVSDRLIAIDEAGRWRDLPALDLSSNARRDLARLMPGTQAQLERHEWLVHGTCTDASAETYFKRSVTLAEAVNASAVSRLLSRNIGNTVSRNQIRAAFDADFGDGAGRKVRVDCRQDGKRNLIYELRINLRGNAMSSLTLADLMRAAPNASAGCTSGLVDRAGLQ